MQIDDPTKNGQAVTALILKLFRLNGQLLQAGDRLVAELGLTSARWQILGEIAYAPYPQPVAWHARQMGVNRQGVQRIVNELQQEGILAFAPNPHHKRARLVVLTPKGQALFTAAMAKQVPWVNQLAEGLSSQDLSATLNMVEELTARLEAARSATSDPAT